MEFPAIKEMIGYFALTEREETYVCVLKRLARRTSQEGDTATLHSLLRECAAGPYAASDAEMTRWSYVIANLVGRSGSAPEQGLSGLGVGSEHCAAAIRAIVTRVTSSESAMAQVARVHDGDISVFDSEANGGLGTDILVSCVELSNWGFISWLCQGGQHDRQSRLLEIARDTSKTVLERATMLCDMGPKEEEKKSATALASSGSEAAPATGLGKRRRGVCMGWTDACAAWFDEHVNDEKYGGSRGQHWEWEQMAIDMNEAVGSDMDGKRMKNRYTNLRAKRRSG